jgi:hypothetical protein
MTVEFRLNPHFSDDLKKMLDGKPKAVEQLRCTIHDKQAWAENRQLQVCCEDMARRVREALEKR